MSDRPITVSDPDMGYSGGYRVMLCERELGRVERYYPTWERRPKGRMWVNSRGTCKRAEYRAYVASNEHRRPVTCRTLRDAVQWIMREAQA